MLVPHECSFIVGLNKMTLSKTNVERSAVRARGCSCGPPARVMCGVAGILELSFVSVLLHEWRLTNVRTGVVRCDQNETMSSLFACENVSGKSLV